MGGRHERGGRRVSARARTILKLAFYVGIVVAFGWYLTTVDWASLDGLELAWGWLILATAVAVAFRYAGVLIWRLVLIELGARDLPRFGVLADVYARAWMARYIPGTIPWIAGKVYLAAEHGISKSRLAVSSVVEAAAQIIGVGAVSLALLAADGRILEVSPALRWLVALGAVALGVGLLPPVFNRVVRLGFRLVRRGTPVAVQWRLIGLTLSSYGAAGLLSGLAYALLALALAPGLGARDILFLVGAFGFAGVVGMLTPFVPSGLGTRDGVQLLLLLIVLDPALATVVVLVSRLWSAVVDVLFWSVAAAWVRRRASVPT